MFLNFFTFKFVTSEEPLGLEFLLAYFAGDALDDHLLAGGPVGRLHVLLQVALPVERSAAQIAPAPASQPSEVMKKLGRDFFADPRPNPNLNFFVAIEKTRW